MNKKSKNILIVGIGKFFQTFHLNNLILNNFKIKEIYDYRNKLVLKFLELRERNTSFKYVDIRKNLYSSQNVLICTERENLFYYIKKILNKKNINIFCEKPVVNTLEEARQISNLVCKNNCNLSIGYMLRYDESILKLRKYLEKNKDLLEINFSISNNNIYALQKRMTYLRTDEKLFLRKRKYPIFLKKKYITNYKIFINRYSHIINLVNFFFKKINVVNFDIKSKYAYEIKLEHSGIPIYIKTSNNKNYEIKIKAIYESGAHFLVLNNLLTGHSSLSFKSKQKNKTKLSQTNLFFKQIKNFFNSNFLFESRSNQKDLVNDFVLIENLWKLSSKVK